MGTHRRVVESNPVNWSSLLRIPEGMRRPFAAREALGFSPLVEAGWADASCIKSIPLIAAGAEPFVVFARRPTAQRAADVRRFRSAGALLFFKLAVWNDERIISDRTHACPNRTAQPPRTVF